MVEEVEKEEEEEEEQEEKDGWLVAHGGTYIILN